MADMKGDGCPSCEDSYRIVCYILKGLNKQLHLFMCDTSFITPMYKMQLDSAYWSGKSDFFANDAGGSICRGTSVWHIASWKWLPGMWYGALVCGWWCIGFWKKNSGFMTEE